MTLAISGANPAYSLQSVLAAQIAVLTQVDQASSGKRITSAAVDPSGLAIYNTLTTQAQGADTANLNVTDAVGAVNVAQGTTSSVQSALGQLNSLAIEANNGFNSPSDTAALQTQANGLIQQINGDAAGTTFNGTPLSNGANAGPTPPAAPSAAITSNDQTNAGGGVVAGTSASAATTSGTFRVAVDATGNADIAYTDSATQTTTTVGSFAAGASTTYNGTTITVGNISAADAGASSTIQTTAATTGASAPTVSVQSGPNAGQTTNVSLPNVTTAGLGIANIDLSNPASATNAEGQISGAVATLAAGQAQLGAQAAALGAAFSNNAVLANNLTASASAIGDVSEAQASTGISSSTLQQQISYAVLARANADAGHLNSFLSQYA
jgi:flagellin